MLKEERSSSSRPLSPRERTVALIALQTFEGSFPLTQELAILLGTDLANLETKLQQVSLVAILDTEQKKTLWATMLAVGMFERKWHSEKDVWELVVGKAKTWSSNLAGIEQDDLSKLKGLADSVVDGL
jgi:hypothetical protein